MSRSAGRTPPRLDAAKRADLNPVPASAAGTSPAWVLALCLAGLWALLWAVALLRPLQPVDETRYAAVAWEMWQRGDFLLPMLNGEPYHHKPPLLFWLLHAGWAVFGVGPGWARCIAPIFAGCTLLVSAALARQLWPARPAVAQLTPWVLLALPLYTAFSTALMFDMVLSFFVALGWWGLARAAARGQRWRDFALFALGVAGALYAKGPVALVHLLPAALLVAWWRPLDVPWSRRRWVAGVLLALLAAAAAILAWAVPAAMAGGPAYRDAIFWQQSAGRISSSFAHAAPPWYYLVWLPLVLAPWLPWPRWWGALAGVKGRDRALRLLAVAGGAALLFFTLASGKRLHYLLPQTVLFALLLARALDDPAHGSSTVQPRSAAMAAMPRRWWRHGLHRWPLLQPAQGASLPTTLVPAAILALTALVGLLLAHSLAASLELGASVQVLRLAAAVPLAAAMWLLRWPGRGVADSVRRVAGATVLSMAALMLGAQVALREPYDMQAVAAQLALHDAAGRPLAMRGNYAGEWTFAARLRHPLQEVEAADAAAWLAAHPQGRLVYVHKRPQELPAGARIELLRRYRGSWLAILAAPQG